MDFPTIVAQNVLKFLPAHSDRMNLLVASKSFNKIYSQALYACPPLDELESFDKLMAFLNKPDLSQNYALLVNELNFSGMAAENVFMGDLDACLKLCKNLKVLRLERCFHISNVLVQSIAKHCPQLEQLDLPGCPLSDSVIPELTEKCVNLKRVDFSFTNMSVSSLYFIIKNCPKIEEIDLSECKDVEEMPDLSATAGVSPLTYLNLRNSLVTDPILRFVARHCPKLKTLILESCSDLSDSGMMKVANSCLELATLDLSFCYLLTDLTIQVFTIRATSNKGGKLQELHLSACDNISPSAVHQLVQKATRLELLILDGCEKFNGTYVKDMATYNGDDVTCTFELPALKRLAALPLDTKRTDMAVKTPPPSPTSKPLAGLSRKKSRSLLTKRSMMNMGADVLEKFVEAAYEERAQKIKHHRQTKAADTDGAPAEKDPLERQLEKEQEMEKEIEKEKKLAMRRSMGSLSLGEKYVIPQRKNNDPTQLNWKAKKRASNPYLSTTTTPAFSNQAQQKNTAVLLASGRRNRHTISTDRPAVVGWGSDPESWVNPTQLTANSSTWTKNPAAAAGSGFIDPWASGAAAVPVPMAKPTKAVIPPKKVSAAPVWNVAPTSTETFVYSGTNRGKVLLKLKVETKKGGHQDLIVHEYDDPTKLASEFCVFWDMAGFKAPLIRLITIRKNNALRTKAAK